MSLSLLLALLESRPEEDAATDPGLEQDPGPEFGDKVTTWYARSDEKKELILQALYQALNEVLYDQATIDPEARAFSKSIHDEARQAIRAGAKTMEQALNEAYARRRSQLESQGKGEAIVPRPGRAVGALLAKSVSSDPTTHTLFQKDVQALRRTLRHELNEHFTRLYEQFPPSVA